MKNIALFVLLLIFAAPASAQLPPPEFGRGQHLPEYHFELPDSLSHMVPWHPTNNGLVKPLFTTSKSPTTSVVKVPPLHHDPPKHVTVLKNNVLSMPGLSISNGQAWNWGIFPDAFLDARTISVPMPR